MWTNLGLLANDGDIDIADLESPVLDSPDGLLQKLAAVSTIMLWVRIRKELPDIRLTDGTEKRISDGMQDYITV
tara:strand:+ start:205 stop:426 length:222 start_codon:yes stop_codon:yes gene_type:complete